jgi:glycosyltransferase involved in cell wall biosynthesis
MSGQAQPARITVVIPCFNDGALAREAVASIQEDEPIEIVLVDDASDDPGTREELERLSRRVRLIRHPTNRGQSRARMTGLAHTLAPFVFPLDADDLAERGALAAMADLLQAHPDAGVCFGDYLELGKRELVRAVPERLDPYRIAFTNEYPVSALFRRTLLESSGGWGCGSRGYEDWDLWMRLAETGTIAVHAGRGVITYRRRLHGPRMLDRHRRMHTELYRQLRERHPALFADLRRHRRASDLGPVRTLLYPHVYGGRRRWPVERRIKAALDRAGLWTLRR